MKHTSCSCEFRINSARVVIPVSVTVLQSAPVLVPALVPVPAPVLAPAPVTAALSAPALDRVLVPVLPLCSK